jgi:hypothetical protein
MSNKNELDILYFVDLCFHLIHYYDIDREEENEMYFLFIKCYSDTNPLMWGLVALKLLDL